MFGDADIGAQERTAESLIVDVIRHQRNGNLEAAWEVLVQFHSHPEQNELHLELYTECFLFKSCPRIGFLGALLGKSEDQAGDLNSFCPHWRSMRTEVEASADADELAEIERQFDIILTRGLSGSCSEWSQRQRALLRTEPLTQPTQDPQVVPLGIRDHEFGGWSTVEIAIDGNPVWAVADSGSFNTWLSSFDSPLARYLDGATSLYSSSTISTFAYEAFRVDSFLLGNHGFREVDIHLPLEQPHIEIGYVLGMNVFLQYPAVCFHWTEEQLYLGETGPCDGGLTGGSARLLGNFVIALQIPLEDGSHVDALLDTGMLQTTCSETFVELNGGVTTFPFGQHPTLEAKCSVTDSGPTIMPGNFQILIGLDTFRRFKAFGWELHPLRVYFVRRDSID